MQLVDVFHTDDRIFYGISGNTEAGCESKHAQAAEQIPDILVSLPQSI